MHEFLQPSREILNAAGGVLGFYRKRMLLIPLKGGVLYIPLKGFELYSSLTALNSVCEQEKQTLSIIKNINIASQTRLKMISFSYHVHENMMPSQSDCCFIIYRTVKR